MKRSICKYTRTRLPVRLVYSEECADRSAALRREIAVKRLSRGEKLALVGRMERITETKETPQ